MYSLSLQNRWCLSGRRRDVDDWRNGTLLGPASALLPHNLMCLLITSYRQPSKALVWETCGATSFCHRSETPFSFQKSINLTYFIHLWTRWIKYSREPPNWIMHPPILVWKGSLCSWKDTSRYPYCVQCWENIFKNIKYEGKYFEEIKTFFDQNHKIFERQIF